MSAIEVLGELLEEQRNLSCMDNPEIQDKKIVALKEALLALEQKEKLKQELEKKVYRLEMYGAGIAWHTRLNVYKEVLGVLK